MLKYVGLGAVIGAAFVVGACAYSVYSGQPFAAPAGTYSIATGIGLGAFCGLLAWGDTPKG